MSLTIQVRTDNGAVVVTLAGSAQASLIAPLRDLLTAALADSGLLVVDLDGAAGLDAVALRAMLLDVLAAVPDGQLRVAAHPETLEALTEAGVHHVAALHPSLTDALRDANSRRSIAPQHDQPRPAFSVAEPAIPSGVLCRSCGRLHMPARLWPTAIRGRPGGDAEVELRCVRCNAAGSLHLRGDEPEERALLAVWQEHAPVDNRTHHLRGDRD